MKKTFLKLKNLVMLSLCFVILPLGVASGQNGNSIQKIEVGSSPNAVGSGAKALGMGGAFIAVSDDVTAASWNPAGLSQMALGRGADKDWEVQFSLTGALNYRDEDNVFGTNPEANGSQDIGNANLNYLSLSFAKKWALPMTFALTYQYLYDFNRKWEFNLDQSDEMISINQDVDSEQEGDLGAYGFSWAVMVPQINLSIGATLNMWEDGIYNNEWEQVNRYIIYSKFNGSSIYDTMTTTENYSFSGYTANLGLLWKSPGEQWALGAVYKSKSFNEELEYNYSETSTLSESTPDKWSGELELPQSFGLGLAWSPVKDSGRPSGWTISLDAYMTKWDDFIIRDNLGREKSAVTGLPINDSDIDSTLQVRAGTQYVYKDLDDYYLAFRGGIFYDPEPAIGSPDNFYGFSLGTGIGVKYLQIDLAYQFRYGDDVGTSVLNELEFSQDVTEHMAYASIMINY